MRVWPPPPTIERQEPIIEPPQARKLQPIGYAALASSTVAILIRALVFLKVHNALLGGLSLLLVSVGLVLGLIARSTLAGRLALLGPVPFLGLIVYYLLCWYGVL